MNNELGHLTCNYGRPHESQGSEASGNKESSNREQSGEEGDGHTVQLEGMTTVSLRTGLREEFVTKFKVSNILMDITSTTIRGLQEMENVALRFRSQDHGSQNRTVTEAKDGHGNIAVPQCGKLIGEDITQDNHAATRWSRPRPLSRNGAEKDFRSDKR